MQPEGQSLLSEMMVLGQERLEAEVVLEAGMVVADM